MTALAGSDMKREAQLCIDRRQPSKIQYLEALGA
jgi:hypothetical protein